MFQFIQKIWKHCFREKPRVRVTRGFLKILDCFLRNQERWLSGADVMKDTGLWSDTVYPLTARMVDGGWLQLWKVADGRHVFKLKDDAKEQAKDMLAKNAHIWQPSKMAA